MAEKEGGSVVSKDLAHQQLAFGLKRGRNSSQGA